MEKRRFDISSSGLHIIAMAFMLCDHLWATVVLGNHQWLTAIGRLAFPIFAFLIAEGYFHTRSFKKYALRLLIFAAITEIPFNLMTGGGVFYPVHQNVLWTLLFGLVLIRLNERAREKGRHLWVRILIGVGTVMLGLVGGYALFLDFFGVGVVTVLVFYFFRRRKWWCLVGQIVALWFLNTQMLGGLGADVTLFGHSFFIGYQGLAILSLIPIWLYRGRKGHSSQAFKYFCYAFYPAHMIILYVLSLIFA